MWLVKMLNFLVKANPSIHTQDAYFQIECCLFRLVIVILYSPEAVFLVMDDHFMNKVWVT